MESCMLRVSDTEVSVTSGPEGLLGEGSFGEVRRALFRGKMVAAKALFLLNEGWRVRPEDRERIKQKFLRECTVLSRLRHDNIVRFVAVAFAADDSPTLIIQELLSRSLAELLKSGSPPKIQRLAILCQIANGLTALHEQNIIHRDVKSSNVLLDANGVAKLCDVGEAFELPDGDASATMSANHGTPLYMAPDMRSAGRKTTAVDVFSYGVLVVEVDTGVSPPSPLGPETSDDGTLGPGQLIPEVQRRANDLAKMTTPLLSAIARLCLRDHQQTRPTAADLHALLADTVAANDAAAVASQRAADAEGRAQAANAAPAAVTVAQSTAANAALEPSAARPVCAPKRDVGKLALAVFVILIVIVVVVVLGLLHGPSAPETWIVWPCGEALAAQRSAVDAARAANHELEYVKQQLQDARVMQSVAEWEARAAREKWQTAEQILEARRQSEREDRMHQLALEDARILSGARNMW